MKCELCNGKGVINDADTLYGVRYCPKCDAGNLQLRLDHKFQPVLERMEDKRELSPTQQRTEEAYIAAQVEAWGREPNPIYQDIPFIPAGDSLQNQDWTPGRRVPPAVQEFNEKRGACSRCIGTGLVSTSSGTSCCPVCFGFDSKDWNRPKAGADAYDNFKPGRDVA